jgi:signal transduction histidine kinase
MKKLYYFISLKGFVFLLSSLIAFSFGVYILDYHSFYEAIVFSFFTHGIFIIVVFLFTFGLILLRKYFSNKLSYQYLHHSILVFLVSVASILLLMDIMTTLSEFLMLSYVIYLLWACLPIIFKPHLDFPTFAKSIEIKTDLAKLSKYEKKESVKKKKLERKAKMERVRLETELNYQAIKKEIEEKNKKFK